MREIEIIPTINVGTFNEVKEKIRIAEPYARWVHLDVADGSFTKTISWHTASDLSQLHTPLLIEVHFMVRNPEEKIRAWLQTPVRRMIVHEETTHAVDSLIALCHESKIEAAVAIAPDTSWDTLLPYAKTADMFQTLAVPPGPSGQDFDTRIYKKLEELHRLIPAIPLEVDGGVKMGIARECVQRGATRLVAGAALFSGNLSFGDAYASLENDAST